MGSTRRLAFLGSNGYQERASYHTRSVKEKVRNTRRDEGRHYRIGRVIVLKPMPSVKDWAGADTGKYSYSEAVGKLDRLRRKWR